MGLDTIPTGIATGVAGSLLGARVVNNVPANGTLVLLPGIYVLVAMGLNVSYQVQDDAGGWNNVVAINTAAPLIYSDGTNFRFNNAAGAIQTATTIKIG